MFQLYTIQWFHGKMLCVIGPKWIASHRVSDDWWFSNFAWKQQSHAFMHTTWAFNKHVNCLTWFTDWYINRLHIRWIAYANSRFGFIDCVRHFSGPESKTRACTCCLSQKEKTSLSSVRDKFACVCSTRIRWIKTRGIPIRWISVARELTTTERLVNFLLEFFFLSFLVT